MEHAQWRDMARATAHVRSFWKFFHFVNQFPRPARENGHPVLSSRFLSRVFVITISSHLKVMMDHDNMLYLIFFYTFKPQMARSINVSRWHDFEICLCEYSFSLSCFVPAKPMLASTVSHKLKNQARLLYGSCNQARKFGPGCPWSYRDWVPPRQGHPTSF
jgi:hypothetical protein